MKFIELTQRSGTKIFVRADAILSVERRPGEDMTILYTGGPGAHNPGGYMFVQEDVEQVIRLASDESIAYPADREDSDASCLLRTIYQIAFNKGVNSTEAVLKDKQELLQALCKYKVDAEQTASDSRFRDAFLKLLKELCCFNTLCEDDDYYLDNIGSALKGVESSNNFICEVYETLFPDRDALCSVDVVAKIDEVLDEIRNLKNTASRVHECAKAENALYDTQDELRDVNNTLDRIRESLEDIESALEG